MKDKYNILVSGCGGDIGQSIGKILRRSNLTNNLYGIDITDKNAAKFIYSNFSIGLPVRLADFLSSLKEFITRHNIDLFISASEPELRYFTIHNILHEMSDSKMIHANRESLITGFDKLKTIEFLQRNDMPFPRTFLGKDYAKMDSYPFILKSRKGSGGKDLHIIENENDIRYLKGKIILEDYIAQEFLAGNSEEYTCGLFRGINGEIRSIIFRRELTDGGQSGYGELVENPEITSLLNSIAQKINLTGSINVQLRLKSEIPYVFEINPRFSSTVLFRSLFNFNDVLWSIQDAMEIPLSKYKKSNGLRKFYKGFSEYVS